MVRAPRAPVELTRAEVQRYAAELITLDRYLRMRRGDKRADTPALWVGVGGKGFAYLGLNDTLRARAQKAGSRASICI